MDYMTHDILKIQPDEAIFSSVPAWAAEWLIICPYVTVRRAPAMGGSVPIGIRGERREQRQAAWASEQNICLCISARELAVQKKWRMQPDLVGGELAGALETADRIFEEMDLSWGPVGSVGYALASGFPVIHAKSDLDLVLYCGRELERTAAQVIRDAFCSLRAHIDALIETPCGGVALAEYAAAGEQKKLLLRTQSGPVLVKNPWNMDSSEER